MVAPSPGRSLGRSLPVLAAAPPAGQPIRPCPDIAPRRAPQPPAAHRALHRTGGGGIVAETATCPEPIMADQYLPATPTVQVDDERVRVTEWRIPKGGATSWHRHEMPYVVIQIAGGRLRVATADGDVPGEMVDGTAY